MRLMIFAMLCILQSLFPTTASAAPPCIPGIYGEQVGNTTVELEEEGRFGHWYCKGSTGAVSSHGLACLRGTCIPVSVFFERLDTAKMNPATAADTVKASWDAAVAAGQCSESTNALLKSLCGKMQASVRAKWPGGYPATQPPPAPPAPPSTGYSVKPNPACTTATGCTRPVFDYVNGVRGTKEVGRAPVRAYCDMLKDSPKVPSTGTDLWLQFGPDYAPNKLTLCSLQTLAP